MERRKLFSWLAATPLLTWNSAFGQEPKTQKLKIMMKSAWGSDDPTRASFPFVHGLALAEAGHDVQIFLVGEGTYTSARQPSTRSCPSGGHLCARLSKRLSPNILRFLLEGCPWGHGSRFEPMGCKVRQSGDLCLAGGMGGSNHHGVICVTVGLTSPTHEHTAISVQSNNC